MTRLLVKTPQVAPIEITLGPGCNRVGREGENDFLVTHPSISRQHCEVWLTEDSVLVRDLGSSNGTYIEGQPVSEAQVFTGQTLRLGEVEMILADAPTRVIVPNLHLPHNFNIPTSMPDGRPCCQHHQGVVAKVVCTSCRKNFCSDCVREMRVAGGPIRRFCPVCRGACELIAAPVKKSRLPAWLNKIVNVFRRSPKK